MTMLVFNGQNANATTPWGVKVVPLYATETSRTTWDPVRTCPLPPGLFPLEKVRSSNVVFNSDEQECVLIVGGFNANAVQLKNLKFTRMGITPPETAPTLSITVAGAITGDAIGYVTFYDAEFDRDSPLSGPSNTLTMTADSRTWTNLPTVPPDEISFLEATSTVNASTTVNCGYIGNFCNVGDQIAASSLPTTWATVIAIVNANRVTTNLAIGNGTTQRIYVRRHSSVTHIRLWCSMDGGSVRLVGTYVLGTTTVTENVPTLFLGAAKEDHSIFPTCRYNAKFHQRQFMTGDFDHPNRIYYSQVNRPEYMEGYWLTKDGSSGIALWENGDNLLVGTDKNVQVLNGYTEDDFNIQILEPGIQVLNHHSIKKWNNAVIVPASKCIYLNEGVSFINISKGFEEEWRESYDNIPKDTFAVIDQREGVYKLWIYGAVGNQSTSPSGFHAVYAATQAIIYRTDLTD